MNELSTRKPADMTPEELGSEIRMLTAQARRMVLDYGIQIGYRLQLAKDKVEGSFAEWVERETEFSKSSAYRFIQLYSEYGSGQGSLFGAENIFPTLGKVSISNALRLLSIPEEEREEFAAEVDAEHISSRELDEAIRERDAAKRALAEAEEGMALKLAEAEEKADAAKEKSRELADKVKELEARPVEVAIQPDTESIKRAEEAEARAQKLEDELKQKQQELEDAQKTAGEAAESAKTAAENAAKSEIERLRATAEKAKAEAEELRRKAAASDGTVSAMNAYIQAALQSINRAAELLRTVENQEMREKLKGAMRKLAQMIEQVAE